MNKQEQWNTIITEYQQQNNIEVKCLSDRVMLYCRYVIDKLDELGLYSTEITEEEYNGQDYVGITDKEIFTRYVNKIYHNTVRGNLDFSGVSPKSLASGIIYIACVMNGTNLTQDKVAELLGISVVSLRHVYKKMKPLLGIPS